MLTPLHYPRFRRVWSGQLVNILGDAVYSVAIPLFLLPRADAAATIGTVMAAAALGGVVALLVSGALADRHRRSRIIVAADLIRAIGLIAIIALGVHAPVYALIACSAVMGVGSGLYRPAYMALLPTLVADEAMPGVNAVRTLTGRLSIIIGSLIAGALTTWLAPRSVLLVDLASFAVSVVTLLGLGEQRPQARGRRTLLTDVAGGFRYIGRHRWMLAIMLQGTAQIAFVAGAVAVCLPLLVGRHGIWYGLTVVAEALGAIVGTTILAPRKPALPGVVAMLALLCQVPQLIAIALHAPASVIAILSAGAGFGLSVFAVLWIGGLQSQVAPNQLGRVFAMDQLTATGLSPVGLAVAGWAIAAMGIEPTAWTALGVLVVSVLAVLPVRGVATLSSGDTNVIMDASGLTR